MTKKILVILLLLLSAFPCIWSQEYKMVVHQKDGRLFYSPIEKIDSVTISSTGELEAIDLSSVDFVEYSDTIVDLPYYNVENVLEGKHVFAIGDSHVEKTKQNTFMGKLESLSHCFYHQILKKRNTEGNVTFWIDDCDTGVSPNCDGFNWSQFVYVIKEWCLSNDIPFDYLFIENCHFAQWELESNPFIYFGETPILLNNGKPFCDFWEAYYAWEHHTAEILDELGIYSKDNASFKMRYVQSASQELFFEFNGGDALNMDTNIKISFSNQSFVVSSLTEGMSLEECVSQINQRAFSECSDWNNLNQGVSGEASIFLTYVGGKDNDPTAIATYEITAGSNLVMTAYPTVTCHDHDYAFVGSENDSLTDKSKWIRAGGYNGWSYPNYMFGAIEWLQEKSPETNIVVLGIASYSSSNEVATYENGILTNNGSLYSDGTINPYAILNSTTALSGKRSKLSSKLLADKYDLQYIDLEQLCGITPYNMYSEGFYRYNDIHPNAKGYQLWAECISLYVE